jgi:hypothetical protein
MTQTHPITPPPELVASLRNSAPHGIRDAGVTRELWLINSAYRAGADQELEACIQLLDINGCPGKWVDMLRAARRPKLPSAVAQAETLIERHEDGWVPSPAQWHTIREGLAEGRRALEALPND